MNTTLTKKGFLSLLQSNRGLYAYIIITPDNGLTVKQHKQAWIDRVKSSDCDEWEVIVDDNSIFIG
jgi:hypothetical protein